MSSYKAQIMEAVLRPLADAQAIASSQMEDYNAILAL